MKVSIITINYNNAIGLEKTIRSVLEQTYADLEFIIIDGGSTDESFHIIESFSDKVSYAISEPDKGIYDAMNKGILQAKGEYCHFLNSGDIYADKDVLLNVFDGKEYLEPILRGIQICNAHTGVFRLHSLGKKNITLFDLYTDSIQHQAAFIKRSLFNKYGLYDDRYKIVSDWKFFLQVILAGEKTLYLNRDIVIFDMTGVSNQPDFRGLLYKERHEIIEEIIPEIIRADYDRFITMQKEIRKYRRYIRLGKFINRLIYK